MEPRIRKAFKKIGIRPEPALVSDIWRAIEMRQSRTARVKAWAYGIAGIGSLAGSVFAIRGLITESARSGFSDYLSLAFSDGGSVAAYWKEFALTILDSLPVMSIIASLGLLFVLFVSIRRVTKQFRYQLTTI